LWTVETGARSPLAVCAAGSSFRIVWSNTITLAAPVSAFTSRSISG